jgi:hypothetical protein
MFRRSAAGLLLATSVPRLTPWATDLAPLRGCLWNDNVLLFVIFSCDLEDRHTKLAPKYRSAEPTYNFHPSDAGVFSRELVARLIDNRGRTEGAPVMKLIRLTLSIFLLAGFAAAHGRYERIDTTDFINHPSDYHGRLVEVTADVIAISADGKSLELFDSRSRMMITVTLTQLQKSQRRALMHSPVRCLVVYGQAMVLGNQLTIDAHRFEALPVESANRQPSRREAGGGGR